MEWYCQIVYKTYDLRQDDIRAIIACRFFDFAAKLDRLFLS